MSERKNHLIEEICAYSLDFYDQLESTGYPCGLTKCGVITAACTPNEVSMLQSEHAALQQSGYASEFLSDKADIIRVEPALQGTSALAALHAPLGAYIDPMQATVSASLAAQDGGVAIHEQQEVQSVFQIDTCNYLETLSASGKHDIGIKAGHMKTHRYGVVTTTGEQYTAAHVVFANGISLADTLHYVGLHVPIYPVKGTMCETYFPYCGVENGMLVVGLVQIYLMGKRIQSPLLSRRLYMWQNHNMPGRVDFSLGRSRGEGLPTAHTTIKESAW